MSIYLLFSSDEHFCTHHINRNGFWINGGSLYNPSLLWTGGYIWLRNKNYGSYDTLPTTCLDAQSRGLVSGPTELSPNGYLRVTAYCDQDTNGGGWYVMLFLSLSFSLSLSLSFSLSYRHLSIALVSCALSHSLTPFLPHFSPFSPFTPLLKQKDAYPQNGHLQCQ